MKNILATFPAIILLLGISACDSYTPSPPDEAAVRRAAAKELISAAEEEAPRIEKNEDKVDAYLSLAEVQLTLEEPAAAKENMRRAMTIIEKMDGDTTDAHSTLTHLYTRLVYVQAGSGDVDAAKATALKISHGWWKIAAYASVAEAQAKRNDNAGARRTLTLAVQELEKNKEEFTGSLMPICVGIAHAWAKTGDIAGAKAFVEKLPDDPMAGTASYNCIAQIQAEAGDTAGAYKTIETAQDAIAKSRFPSYKTFSNTACWHTYMEIAEHQAKAGDVAGFTETLSRLQKSVESVAAIASDQWKSHLADYPYMGQTSAFITYATRQQKAGHADNARRYIQKAEAAADKLQDFFTKSLVLLQIGDMQLQLGDKETAFALYEKAKTAAANIESIIPEDTGEHRNIYAKIMVYSSIMAALAKADDNAEAKETLEMIYSLIDQFSPEDFNHKSMAYRQIAAAQAEAGDFAAAKATLSKIESQEDKDEAYGDIVRLQAQSGDSTGAVEYCRAVFSDPYKRCECLVAAAKQLCDEENMEE